MRSQRGYLAAWVLLLALPLTVLYQIFFSGGADTVIHWLLATGALLLALAVFDFGQVAKGITWLACLAAAGEGTIFLLQGTSHLVQNAAFTDLAYQTLGQWPERVLLDLIIVWCVVLWGTESSGKARLIGFVALASVIALETYSYFLTFMGSSINATAPGLKLVYLLPFVWLLLESSKKPAHVRAARLPIQRPEAV